MRQWFRRSLRTTQRGSVVKRTVNNQDLSAINYTQQHVSKFRYFKIYAAVGLVIGYLSYYQLICMTRLSKQHKLLCMKPLCYCSIGGDLPLGAIVELAAHGGGVWQSQLPGHHVGLGRQGRRAIYAEDANNKWRERKKFCWLQG